MADAIAVAPDIYSVKLENARVRVLEIRTRPGQSSVLHSHPDMVLYAVTDCEWRLGSESGRRWMCTSPKAIPCSWKR